MQEEPHIEPVPVFITAGASVLSAANGFTGALGVSPFWADSIIGTLLCIVLAFWVYQLFKRVMSNRRSRGKLVNFKTLVSGIGMSAGLAVILLALSVWTWVGPFRQIRHPRWTFCGRIATSCPNHPCLVLFDWKGRKIRDECYLASDDSGYFDIRDSHWYIYQPKLFAVSCGDKVSQLYSADSMFRNLCDGSLDLR